MCFRSTGQRNKIEENPVQNLLPNSVQYLLQFSMAERLMPVCFSVQKQTGAELLHNRQRPRTQADRHVAAKPALPFSERVLSVPWPGSSETLNVA